MYFIFLPGLKFLLVYLQNVPASAGLRPSDLPTCPQIYFLDPPSSLTQSGNAAICRVYVARAAAVTSRHHRMNKRSALRSRVIWTVCGGLIHESVRVE